MISTWMQKYNSLRFSTDKVKTTATYCLFLSCIKYRPGNFFKIKRRQKIKIRTKQFITQIEIAYRFVFSYFKLPTLFKRFLKQFLKKEGTTLRICVRL